MTPNLLFRNSKAFDLFLDDNCVRITKCDLCKKEVDGEPIIAGIGIFPKAELCEKCGLPILRFLRKYKFIELEKNKHNPSKQKHQKQKGY